jgi:uncharacterized membrane protein (UPF0127 family)
MNGRLMQMTTWKFGRALAFVALLGVGCGSSDRPGATSKSQAPATKTNAPAANTIPLSESPTKAQPKLKTLKFWLGAEELVTELALTPQEVETGMMFRTQMAENEGMIFVFAGPRQVAFWMRNTLVPLSCAYIDPEGTILELHDMKPKDETPIPSASARVQYVLEVNQGWFQRHNIAVGTQIRTERGTLAETFFRRQ